MSLVTPIVSPLIADLTAAPGGESLPYAPPPPPPPPPPPQPAVLAIIQIGPQEAGGNVPVSYSIDKTDTGVAAVLYAAAEAPPQAADFDGAGAPTYADLGTLTLDTSGTPLDLDLPDELNGSYRLALLPSGGGDAHVAVSAAVTIDTTVSVPPSNPMGDDAGTLYWYGADDTTRSGTDVTGVADKGGAAFDLTSTPAAFGAPQQADAGAPVGFDATGPTIIQTPTKAAANRLLQQTFIGGGSVRVFIVLDGASINSFFSTVLAETNDHQSNLSILFGTGKFGSNLRFYALARQFANAVTINYDSGIPLTGLGTVIVEYLVTQSNWTTYLNGTQNSTGAVTPASFPTYAEARISLGGRASDTTSNDSATCDWREIFITSTVGDTHAADIRAQLAAKHSITL